MYFFSILIGIMLFSLIFIDYQNYIIYFTKIIFDYRSAWIVRTISNQSVLALLYKLFGHTIENTIPVFYFPKIIFPIYYFYLFIIFTLLILLTKKIKEKNFILNIYIIFIILIFAVNWYHTFTILLIPLIYYYYLTKDKKILDLERVIFLISFILIIIDYNPENLTKKFQLLLTAPKLYGTILLLFLYLNYWKRMKN